MRIGPRGRIAYKARTRCRDHAARFIREHDATKPFFPCVAYTAAHWQLHARDRDIAKYAGRYVTGHEAIRKARYEKMLTEGVVTEAETTLWPLPPKLGEQEEWLAWDRRNMEVYAAMVDCMDQGIGRIVKAIEDAGQVDNTIVCYLQDNGGCAEPIGRSGVGSARAESPTLPPLEGKSLAPLFAGEAIYWEHEGNKAIREGDWKLVATHGDPWELHDLSRDRSEQNDLSGAEPDRVRRMAAMWEVHAARSNVEPWNNVFPAKKK